MYAILSLHHDIVSRHGITHSDLRRAILGTGWGSIEGSLMEQDTDRERITLKVKINSDVPEDHDTFRIEIQGMPFLMYREETNVAPRTADKRLLLT